MLNYVQAPERMTVPVFSPQYQPRTGQSSTAAPFADRPLSFSPVVTPEEAREQGQQAGRAEAAEMLAQAELAKGEALTKPDVLSCYGARFTEYLKQDHREEPARSISDGWYQGFAEVCLQARDATPEPATLIDDVPVDFEPEPVAGTVTFRQARITTDDVEEFTKGIECGQSCFVEDRTFQEMTTRSLASLFAGAIDADDPETYNIGFIIGYADALCRDLRIAPLHILCGAKETSKSK